MLFRSALHPSSSMGCLLLTAALVSGPGLTLSAQTALQTPSRTLAALQPVAQADRIAAHPDFAHLTQLGQQLPGWVQGASQSSAHSIDLSTILHITLVLRRDDTAQAAFTQLLADQQNPASPLYHQWLTPQQIGQIYGPTPNDLSTLSSWLTSQGLKIDAISPSNVLISVSGTAALIGNAFHTSFASFDLSSAVGDGEPTRTRLSAVSEPTIPAALSPLIRSIHGLAEVPLQPMSHATAVHGSLGANSSTPRPLFTFSSGEHFLTPDDFAVIYDISSVYSGGDKGATIGSKPQHIAVIGVSRVSATDISEYETNTGLPSIVPNVIIPAGATDPGLNPPGDQEEATLDVDRVIGTAPGATVDLVIAADTKTSDGIFTAAQYNVETLLDPVMTISFGDCEADAGLSGVDYVDSLASTGVAEGITTLVSAGDSGVAGCDTAFVAIKQGITQVAGINFICSTAYVTCVGGTEFNDTANPSAYWSATNAAGNQSALQYIPEGAWNEPSSVDPTTKATVYAPAATGGGVSTFIAKPNWQTGTGVPSGSFRYVPDISFAAAGHDGYYACEAGISPVCSNASFVVFSGTSAAAPGMAGVVALINTKTGTASGNINPKLYSLASSNPDAFHDATIASSGVANCTTTTPSTCNNSIPGPTGLSGGLAGFELTAGFDQATGLGSIDVANLVSAVSGGSGFTLAANPSALSFAAGATSSNTSTITGTSNNSYAGTVALACKVAYNGSGTANDLPTCSLSPSSIALTSGATATSTLAIASTAATTGSCTTQVSPMTTPWQRGSGIVLASLLLLILPLRKRRAIRALAMACLFTAGIASMGGCGGNSTGGTACPNDSVAGTTPGSYTVTITGTQGASSATTNVAITIN
jgi:pseudomonalisin